MGVRGLAVITGAIYRPIGLKQHLVDEAPSPILTRFERNHDRMTFRAEMLGRMLVG